MNTQIQNENINLLMKISNHKSTQQSINLFIIYLKLNADIIKTYFTKKKKNILKLYFILNIKFDFI